MCADDPLPDLDEALDADPARGERTVRRRGPDERRDVAGVVDLGVVVGHAADEGVLLQARHVPEDLLAAEVPVVRDAGRTAAGPAEHVVHRHADADVEALPHAVVERVEEAHGLHEVRGDPLQEQTAFDQGLADEGEVELLEVADAAVHELRRTARRARAPVAGLDDADAQAAGDRVERTAAADDPAADHQDVELAGLQRLDRRGALVRAELGGRVEADPAALGGVLLRAVCSCSAWSCAPWTVLAAPAVVASVLVCVLLLAGLAIVASVRVARTEPASAHGRHRRRHPRGSTGATVTAGGTAPRPLLLAGTP